MQAIGSLTMEINIYVNDYVSESRRRKKKGKNKRSAMLRMIMPHLSRKTGDALADAIDNADVSRFKTAWDKVKHEISKKLMETKSSEDAEEVEDMEALSALDLDEVYEELTKTIITSLT